MGSYVQNTLLNGEEIFYETKLHWVIFLSLKSFLSFGILPLIKRLTSEYVITNKRIIIKTGLISRHTLEMNMPKIETINVEQSIFGRIFDYGTITIIGTGGTKEAFEYIKDPLEFRKNYQIVSMK